MKKNLFILCLVFCANFVFGQDAAYLTPNRPDVSQVCTLFVDLNALPANEGGFLKGDTIPKPLYLWTWHPSENATIPNGTWGNSNDAMAMTEDPNTPGLWFFVMTPTQFYNRPAPVFYDDVNGGIKCLVKAKNGNGTGGQEHKTRDLTVTILPPLDCIAKMCYFPTKKSQRNFFQVTYDNSLEERVPMQNLAPNDVNLYMVANLNGGRTKEVAPIATVGNNPKLRMQPVAGSASKFNLTFIPEEILQLSPSDKIISIRFNIVKQNFAGPNTFTVFDTVEFDCD